MSWEPSDAAIEAALDAYEQAPGIRQYPAMRDALIAAHAVAEKEGATLVEAEREACESIARDQKGKARTERLRKGMKLGHLSQEANDEIIAEERGENIASEEIAAAIRARGNKP